MSRRLGEQLFDAIHKRDVAAVRSLLASGRLGSDVLTDKAGCSAVFHAVQLGDAGMLQALIDAKADVNVSAFPPPIRLAVDMGRIDLLRMLLRAGARPCREGGEQLYLNNGRTVGNNDLHALALVRPHLSRETANEFVKLLVSAGVDINQVNNDFYRATPLVIALRTAHVSVAAVLLALPQLEWCEKTCEAFARRADAELTRVAMACTTPTRALVSRLANAQRSAPSLLALLGGPSDLLRPLERQWALDEHACDEARALIVASELVPDETIQSAWGGWKSRLPAPAAVETARSALERERLVQVRNRFLEVCIALQNLQLPAIQTCAILDDVDSRDIALHHRWRVATLVKHWRKSA